MEQPGAQPGQRTYCPTSGVVFEVKTTSSHRALAGRQLYFCCEKCAQYFTEHQAEMIAARRLSPTS